MKKIINGKVYDTSTAERVGGWNNNCSTSDFGYCSEDLYRKRTGEFFLFGQGNARSRYAKSCGDNEWSGGEKIIPLSYQAAQKWAEDKLNAEQYEAISAQSKRMTAGLPSHYPYPHPPWSGQNELRLKPAFRYPPTLRG